MYCFATLIAHAVYAMHSLQMGFELDVQHVALATLRANVILVASSMCGHVPHQRWLLVESALADLTLVQFLRGAMHHLLMQE